MITNEDIDKLKAVFTTKEDLNRFATKEDLNRFASKEDLLAMEKRFEARYVTKEEFQHTFDDAVREIISYIGEVQQDLKKEIREVRYIANAIRTEMQTHRIVLGEHETRIQALETPVKS